MGYLIKADLLPKVDRQYGGMAGLKQAYVLNSELYIGKFPKNTDAFEDVEISYTTTPICEYIGSHIYSILGYKVQETKLASIFNPDNKKTYLIVLCKDFTKNDTLSILDYEKIKNNYSFDLQIQLEELDKKLPVTRDPVIYAHKTRIEEVILQFDKNKIFKDRPSQIEKFWDMIVIDYIINNNDRNKNNWGMLQNKQTGELFDCPIYDNGGAFYNKHSDAKMNRLLSNRDLLMNSATNAISHFSCLSKRVNFKKMYDYLKENNYHQDLDKAITKLTPIIVNKLPEIKKFIDNIPLEENKLQIISKTQKEFFYKTLEVRVKEVIIPLYKEITGKELKQNEPEVEENEIGFE